MVSLHKKLLFVVGIIAVSVGAITVFSGPEEQANFDYLFPENKEYAYSSPRPGSYHLPIIKPAGDGNVIDENGAPHRLSELMAGRITVLSFIYTLCSDGRGCPLAMATLFDAHDVSEQLPHIAQNVKFISLSFDPERDTPEVMKSYGYPIFADPERHRKIQWDFLTTSSAETLKPILEAYGQVIKPRAEGETIAHLLRLYLVDRAGNIRNIYGLGLLDPRIMFSDIETLLLEEKTREGKPP